MASMSLSQAMSLSTSLLRTVMTRGGSSTMMMKQGAAAAACSQGVRAASTAAAAACSRLDGRHGLMSVSHGRGFAAAAAEGGAADATTDVESAKKEAFLEKWRKVAPSTINEPGFTVVDEEVNVPKDPIPEKMTFSMFLPHHIMYNKQEVDMVLVPGSSGDFGVKAWFFFSIK